MPGNCLFLLSAAADHFISSLKYLNFFREKGFFELFLDKKENEEKEKLFFLVLIEITVFHPGSLFDSVQYD